MKNPIARARATAIVAALVGLSVAVAVIGYFNFGAILAAMRPVGVTGFIAAIAAQLALFLLLGPAWQALAPGEPIDKAAIFIWSRLVREAASDVLPFSQVGGFFAAGRAAVVGGVSTVVALGSSLADATVEIVAQMIYTLIGVAIVARHLGLGAQGDRSVYSLAAEAAIGAIAVAAGIIILQKPGLRLTEWLMHRLSPTAGHQAAAVTKTVERAYARRTLVSMSLVLHVLGWFAAAGGSWLILVFMDRPLPFLSVVGLESLMFAIRNTAFFAPAGLGVQEGAYALLGPLFGLPIEAALALSLLKRARDITIGVPMLLSWQLMESRRRLREA